MKDTDSLGLKSKIDFSVLNYVSQAVWVADTNGLIIFANTFSSDNTGYSEIDLENTSFFKIISDNSKQNFKDLLLKINDAEKNIKKNRSINFNAEIIRKDKSIMNLYISASTIDLKEGSSSLIMLTGAKKGLKKDTSEDNFFKILIEKSEDITYKFQVSPEFKFEYLSPSVCKILGYTVDEIKKEPEKFFFNVEEKYKNILQDVVSGRYDYSKLLVIKRYKKDGSSVYLESSIRPIYDSAGKIISIACTARDINTKKMLEEELNEVNDFNLSLLNNSINPIAIINTDYSIRFINPAFENLTGFSQIEIIGIKPPYPWWDKNKLPFVFEVLKKLTSGEYNRKEMCFKTKQGRSIWVIINCYKVLKRNETAGYVAVLTDITERRKTSEKLKYLSFHDKLTGLYNRAYFEEEIKRLGRSRVLPISLIVGDINNLKLVNDAFGHTKGDYLIKKAAGVIKKRCRKEDIAARWGGDEFAIILPGADLEIVNKIIERIRNKCASKREENSLLSISLGASIKKTLNKDLREVLIEAEREMYDDKIKDTANSLGSVLAVIESILTKKNIQNAEYIERISKTAKDFAASLKLDKNITSDLIILCKLHNIGNIALSEKFFIENAKLSEKDRREMMRHPETGSKIAMRFPSIAHISESILSHHEYYNGHGYPRGLKGNSIPLICRILSIIIAYDVMTKGSNYKGAITREEAIIEMKKFSGEQFDPYFVDKFLEII